MGDSDSLSNTSFVVPTNAKELCIEATGNAMVTVGTTSGGTDIFNQYIYDIQIIDISSYRGQTIYVSSSVALGIHDIFTRAYYHRTGYSATAGLPNITGSTISFLSNGNTGAWSGAFYSGNNKKYAPATSDSGSTFRAINFDASRVSSIYGNASIVLPESLCTQFLIKF